MFNIYRAFFGATINLQLQYRVAAVIWLIGTVIQPVVSLVVWRTVAGSGSIQGYTGADFAAYFLVLMLADQITFTWIMWEYEFQIKSGQFATQLIKPVHPVHRHVADNVTHKLITLVVLLPTFVVLAVLFRPTFHTTLADFLLFFPVVLLGAAIRYLVEYTLALAAFFTTRVSALNQVYMSLLWFLSGMLAPLAILPGPLRTIADVSTFRSMLAFPVELALGRLDAQAVASGVAMQLAWLAVAYGCFWLFWRVSVRAFSAVGT